MNIGKACEICSNINNCDLSEEEKGLAIYVMMNMETHNGITKETLLGVIKYLHEKVFDVSIEEA